MIWRLGTLFRGIIWFLVEKNSWKRNRHLRSDRSQYGRTILIGAMRLRLRAASARREATPVWRCSESSRRAAAIRLKKAMRSRFAERSRGCLRHQWSHVAAGSIGSDFRALRGRFQTAVVQSRAAGDGGLRQNAARQNAIKRLTRRRSIRHLVGKDQNSSTAWAKKMKPRLDWQTSLTPSRLGKCRGRSRKRV